jgi:hypothetical protein
MRGSAVGWVTAPTASGEARGAGGGGGSAAVDGGEGAPASTSGAGTTTAGVGTAVGLTSPAADASSSHNAPASDRDGRPTRRACGGHEIGQAAARHPQVVRQRSLLRLDDERSAWRGRTTGIGLGGDGGGEGVLIEFGEDLGQRAGDLATVGRPLLRIEREALVHQQVEFRRQVRRELAQGADAGVEQDLEDLALRPARDGALARQALVQDGAERENVRAGVDLLAAELFRRHVLQRAHDAARLRLEIGLGHLRESEVEQLDVLGLFEAAVVEEDVVRFQVAMDDPDFVGAPEGLCHGAPELDGARNRHAAFGEALCERAALEEFHDEEGFAAFGRIPDVVHPHHVPRPLAQSLSGLALLNEPVFQRFVVVRRKLRGHAQHLQRPLHLQAGVEGEVHGAHAAAAERADDAVSPAVEVFDGPEVGPTPRAVDGEGIRDHLATANAVSRAHPRSGEDHVPLAANPRRVRLPDDRLGEVPGGDDVHRTRGLTLQRPDDRGQKQRRPAGVREALRGVPRARGEDPGRRGEGARVDRGVDDHARLFRERRRDFAE